MSVAGSLERVVDRCRTPRDPAPLFQRSSPPRMAPEYDCFCLLASTFYGLQVRVAGCFRVPIRHSPLGACVHCCCGLVFNVYGGLRRDEFSRQFTVRNHADAVYVFTIPDDDSKTCTFLRHLLPGRGRFTNPVR